MSGMSGSPYVWGMRAALYALVVLFVLGCGTPPRDATPTAVLASVDPGPGPMYIGPDTAEAYRSAIAEYITVLRQRDGSFPDTIYIGRHDELPDIELPAVIEQTSVHIISPAEAGALRSGAHFTYLNIFGWFTAGQAEFFVVNFKQDMRHWPDGRDDLHLRFTHGAGQSGPVLDSVWQ